VSADICGNCTHPRGAHDAGDGWCCSLRPEGKAKPCACDGCEWAKQNGYGDPRCGCKKFTKAKATTTNRRTA
jgi:hypothetical protein